MNIYIYGNNGFKKEIHQTLEHANIKFKLDEDSIIKDITSLDELKQVIQENPNDIYLIDDEKIIKKNGLSKKIKFLTPKDGIEEEFLLDNGIADLSVDSLAEIPKYILQKHDQIQSEKIHDSIVDIVDEAYNENKDEDDEDYFDEPIELDDELSALLSTEQDENFHKMTVEDEPKEEELEEQPKEDDFDFDELVLDEELTPIEDNADILDDDNLNIQQDINLDDLDSLLSSHELEDQDNISDIDLNKMINFDEDVGLDNVSRDYDDDDSVQELVNNTEDLSEIDKVLENDDIIEELDSMDSFPELDGLDDLDKLIEENDLGDIDSTMDSLDELDGLDELDSINDFDMQEAVNSMKDTVEAKTSLDNSFVSEESNKGESMADEFSELDSLNEADIMSALEGLDNLEPSSMTASKVSSNQAPQPQKESVEVSASNTQDIAELISKLLNNKTLEITIKVKD